MPTKKYNILLTKNAEKMLSKLSAADINKALGYINQLSLPFPANLNIKKMLDTPDFFRLKFSKIRVIFDVDYQTSTIWIRKIGYRKDIYR